MINCQKNNLFISILYSILLLIIFCSCLESENYLVTTDTIQLFIVSGNNQTATAGEYLPSPIVVRLGLTSGTGLSNKIVNVSVVDGDGEITDKIDTTNSNGFIRIDWLLGYKSGLHKIVISSQGVSEIFASATAIPYSGTISVVSGEGQSAFNGDTLLTPFEVIVQDSLGNPISNRLVKSEFSGSGYINPGENETDDDGIARFQFIAGQQTGIQKINFLAGTPNDAEITVDIKDGPSDYEITIFNNVEIKYPESQTISKSISLPENEFYFVEAELDLISPCISCNDSECDPWDRIGYITIDAIGTDGNFTTIELLRFITPYGNSQTYVQNISQYSSLLTEDVKFNAYISTFIGHWNINLKIRFKNATLNNRNFFAKPLAVDYAMFSYEPDKSTNITIPSNNGVKLFLYTTGHNSQGRNCDEFCQKVNRIYIDGDMIEEIIPWRTNCGDVVLNKCGNPQSVQYDRAGWCPGDIVAPYVINLGKLSEGSHFIRFNIPNIEANGGYWRISLAVTAIK